MIRLDYGPLQEVLAADGWDVHVGDAIQARREDQQGVWQLAIDRGGRVRFMQTYPLRPEQSRRIVRDGHRYWLLRQEDVRVTIVGQISGAADLRQFLADLSELVQAPWGDNEVTG